MAQKNIKLNKGFTIIELLVVIVVIGILAAITIVSYGGVTSKAKTTTALSNADSARQVAETYFGEKSYYPANISALNGADIIKMPAGVTAATAFTANSEEKNVKYYICGTEAGTDPKTTRPTQPKGAMITYYDFSTKTEVGYATEFALYPQTGSPLADQKLTAYTGSQKPILLGSAAAAVSVSGSTGPYAASFTTSSDCYKLFIAN